MDRERLPGISPRSRAILGVLVASTLFGTTGTALSQASEAVDPLGAGILRLLLGGVGLVLLAGRDLRTIFGQPLALTIGALGVGVYQLAFFWATRTTGVAMASIVTIGASPIASWLIGVVRRRSAPPRLWFAAALLIAVGLTVLVTGGYENVEVVPRGIVAAVVAGTAYATYTEAGAILIERSVPGTAVMGGLFMGAGLLTSPLLLWTGTDLLQSSRGLLVLGYLGLITLTLAYVAFGRSLSHLAPTHVVMLTLLEPVVAAVLSVVVLHQNLSALGWLGAAVVGFGMILAGRAASSGGSTVGP